MAIMVRIIHSMGKRIPKIVPHQSEISVQDVRDVSTPAGISLENEEMRRLALNVNELSDKVGQLSSPVEQPKTTTNLSGNPPDDAPSDDKLELLHGTRLVVADTKQLQFFNSSTIRWSISEDYPHLGRIIGTVRGTGINALETYNNTTLVVNTTTKMDFVDGTGTTATVTESPAGYATVQIDATGSYLPVGDEHETLRKDLTGVDDNWKRTNRLTNRGDAAVTSGDGVVKVRWQTGDTIPSFYAGNSTSDMIAGKFESNIAAPGVPVSADAVVYVKNYTTGRGITSVSTGGVAGRFETSGNGAAISALANGGTGGSTGIIGISTNAIGNGAYFQGQGTGIGVEVVQNSASGTGIYITSTGAGATALLVRGSNAASNRAIYSEGNVHLADHIGTVVVEFNEAYGSVGVATPARIDKTISNGGLYAGAGVMKVVKVSFDYTSTIVDSIIIIPDGGIVSRVVIRVDGAFDGTAPEVVLSVNGSTPTSLTIAAEADLTTPGQYNVVRLAEISPPYNGVVRATITTSGATTGSAVAYVFYSDFPEF